MNRSELQTALIEQIIDDMDLKTMTALVYDYMMEGYDKYSDAELTEECKEYYPELLEEWYKSCGSSLYSRSAARPVGRVSTKPPKPHQGMP